MVEPNFGDMLTKLLDVLSIEVTRLKYTYVTTRRGPAFREHEIVFLPLGLFWLILFRFMKISVKIFLTRLRFIAIPVP